MNLENAYDKIYRYVYFKMKDQTVAEDITQETFLRFISQKGSIQGYEIKYLYTIARNLCVDEYRRVKPDSLSEGYEETIYPNGCKNSGKISYLKRNQAMIDQSDYCLFYYDKNYLPPKRKWAKRDLFAYQPQSGTALAYKYALQKKKIIYNFFN